MQIASRISCWTSGGTPTPPAPAYWGLYFEAEEDNVVINMEKDRTPPSVTLESSTDGINWTSFDANGTTPVTLAAVGDRVYFRAGANGNSAFGGYNRRNTFTSSGLCGVHGNIMSLLNANDETNVTIPSSNCFFGLFFSNAKITSSPNLPATTLASSCYQAMFQNCINLLTGSLLPATTLVSNCYANMYYGCRSLLSAEVAFTEWNPSNATYSWMDGVTTAGTFTCPAALGDNSTITRGNSNCPNNWTVVNI